ncbi:MAG TPA: hypothetical protein VN613_03175 [Gemmatimonadaceae bacterium]|nr:hypothetical protein [Gemmatimonadaceae bacterium]
MASTYDQAESGTSIREVLRALRNAPVSRDATPLSIVSPAGPALELTPADVTPPRLEGAASIEGDVLAPRDAGKPAVGFAAFLDGIQRSRLVYVGRDGVPVVHGTVAATVRVRQDRVLRTWPPGPRVSGALYAPCALLGAGELAWLGHAPVQVVDTLEATDPAAARHPQELLALARNRVRRRREEIEIALAQAWCAAADPAPLFVDGGISGGPRAALSPAVVGVVKSHRTLYASPETVSVVTGLAEGARTTAFAIRSPHRMTVASWYLRLRDARGRDPFFGLVRIEVAHDSWSAARADEVSRWVLAERAPVSLPDRRWSTMAYGIRDCEEYLRALIGRFQ